MLRLISAGARTGRLSDKYGPIAGQVRQHDNNEQHCRHFGQHWHGAIGKFRCKVTDSKADNHWKSG